VRKVAEKGSSAAKSLPAPLCKALPLSKQAVVGRIMKKLKAQAKQTWLQSPRFKRLNVIDRSMPSKKFLQLVEGLSRHKVSLLMQLQTGNAPLQLTYSGCNKWTPPCAGNANAKERRWCTTSCTAQHSGMRGE